jgi:hypothetical protein
VVAGLTAAARLGPGEPVEVRLTSEVVIFQMTGSRAARDPGLRSLRDQAMRVAAVFPAVVFTKTSTDDTVRVYQLAREALGADLHDARETVGQDPRAAGAGHAAGARAAPCSEGRYRKGGSAATWGGA